MRRRSAPTSGPAANGISILPSGDAIVEVMLDNDDDDTKKSSTASQIRTRLIRFTKPFAILAVCIGICSKAMMMKVISERYSLPILSILTADNRESSYMRRSLKIEEATPPSSGEDGSAVAEDTNAADIDTGVKSGKGNLGQFVMEHKAKSDEEKIAKELKIAQNMIKKAELKAKEAAKEQKKVDDHKKSIEKQQEPNKPQPKVRAHEQHKNKPVMKGSVKLKEDKQSQTSMKAIKHPIPKAGNSKKHPHIKEHHTNKQKDIVVKQAVKKQSDMKHQPIVKGKKHHDKKEKKLAVVGQDKKVKEQHHVAADPIKKDKPKITDAHKHSATKQK